jgi:hypothetical protein
MKHLCYWILSGFLIYGVCSAVTDVSHLAEAGERPNYARSIEFMTKDITLLKNQVRALQDQVEVLKYSPTIKREREAAFKAWSAAKRKKR